MNNLDPILQVSQVSYQVFNSQKCLLEDISFEVRSGDRIGIVGSSGAGKSTLLRLLNRLIDPTSGGLFFKQKPFSDYLVTRLRQQIVLVPQEPKLLGMTVQETLSYPLKLQHLSLSEIKQRVMHYCDLLGIPEDWLERNELQLSVGQRQWVTIVRGLILQPSILLLDEPTSALDMGLGHQLIEQLNALSQAQQLTVIMVNHQLSWVRQFANKIIYLQGGKIMNYQSTDQVNWDSLQQKLITQNKDEEWQL
jgi:D-methionine transport system ATP-binding protein